MSSLTSSFLISSLKENYPHLKNIDPNFFSIFDFEEKDFSGPNFLWNFSPSSDPYYSPLNPIFLHQVESIDELERFPVVLARDGLLPLLWFFERFSPPSFPCKILIYEPFADLVPEIWRPLLGTYQLVSKEKSFSIMTVDKVFIHGLVSKRYLPIKSLRSQLKFMLEEIAKQKLNVERFDLFLSFRDDPYYRKESDKYNSLFVKETLKILGDKVKFISHRELFHKISYGEYKVFEIGQRYFIADNFINYYSLSQGAEQLMNVKPSLAATTEVEISPFHTMMITEELPECKLSKHQIEELIEIKEQSLIGHFPKIDPSKI